jgi:hypothetical protein
MTYKIQVTVDKKMNLSVRSYARLALISTLPQENSNLLDDAISDMNSGNVETLTLSEFNHNIDNLINAKT